MKRERKLCYQQSKSLLKSAISAMPVKLIVGLIFAYSL